MSCAQKGREGQPCRPGLCCITIEFKEKVVPEENQTEHIECANEGCKSVFWRPQNAPEALRTEVLAWKRGWEPVEPPSDPLNPGPMYCAWGHKE